jgi:hypothetical protein
LEEGHPVVQVNVTPPAACASFAEAALKSASILSFYSPEFNTRGTRRGTPRKPLDQPREQLRNWLIAVPDLTLDQLQQKLVEGSLGRDQPRPGSPSVE